jgi:integrase/recombinase XerD
MQLCVQRVKLEQTAYLWLVIDKSGLPVEPVESFLGYLFNIEKSPHTIESYAHHLKLYWQFLLLTDKDWHIISIADLSQFVVWLRNSIQLVTQSDNGFRRVESTVNTILSAVASFYRHHNQLGNTQIQLTEPCYLPVNRHKSLLYHVYKNKAIHKRIISLKTNKTLPKIITKQQMEMALEACSNVRDRFLLCLLYETGLRIGQALSLHHEDIKSFDNEIHIIYRENHPQQLRNKSRKPNVLAISQELMRQYSSYINEYQNILEICPYVFVNIKTGSYLTYPAVRKIFRRLSTRIGFRLTPHMLRHTHATLLIKSGWDAAFVQKRLGHAHVETTINQYVHLEQADLKRAFQFYLKQQAEGVSK